MEVVVSLSVTSQTALDSLLGSLLMQYSRVEMPESDVAVAVQSSNLILLITATAWIIMRVQWSLEFRKR